MLSNCPRFLLEASCKWKFRRTDVWLVLYFSFFYDFFLNKDWYRFKWNFRIPTYNIFYLELEHLRNATFKPIVSNKFIIGRFALQDALIRSFNLTHCISWNYKMCRPEYFLKQKESNFNFNPLPLLLYFNIHYLWEFMREMYTLITFFFLLVESD